jgi:hypothetical protein
MVEMCLPSSDEREDGSENGGVNSRNGLIRNNRTRHVSLHHHHHYSAS